MSHSGFEWALMESNHRYIIIIIIINIINIKTIIIDINIIILIIIIFTRLTVKFVLFPLKFKIRGFVNREGANPNFNGKVISSIIQLLRMRRGQWE